MTVQEQPPQPTKSGRLVLFWILFIALLVVDQLVKAYVRGAFVEAQQKVLIPGVLDMTLTYNRGIAFGMFQGIGVLLAPVAIAIALGSIWYTIKHPREPALNHVIAALFASGALGNLYDRLLHGKVTDMFAFTFVKFPVFNVADSCITVGAFLLFFVWLKEAFERPQPSSKDPGTPETLQPSGE
jgi:signal peptidase II